MTGKLTEWPFENAQTEKFGPSDGCRGNTVLFAAESKYDFRELGAYLGKVGCIMPTEPAPPSQWWCTFEPKGRNAWQTNML